MRILLVYISILFFISCKQDPLPRPNAMLRLEYPTAVYQEGRLQSLPYDFEFNTLANMVFKKDQSLQIQYPSMRATIHFTYKPISGNIQTLLRDAQKLTYEHVVKADQIIEQPFINTEKKTYGMLYEVAGNAASPSQFYLTDSVAHFVTGSVYFYAKPNYDSILPAAAYLKQDLKHLIESFTWKKP